MMLNNTKTTTIPIFPLPNVVFFPKTFLPLHIFEPRYRKMLEDAQSGSNLIGMALLKGGWEKNYFGNPDVHEIGCVGDIQYCEELEDGRYNIMLYGLSRVKILDFVQDRPYRIAKVKYLRDEQFDRETVNINYESACFLGLVREYLREIGLKNLDEILKLQDHSFEAIINQVASFIDLSTIEKQDMLTLDSIDTRLEHLKNTIEEKLRILRIAKNVKYIPEDPRWN